MFSALFNKKRTAAVDSSRKESAAPYVKDLNRKAKEQFHAFPNDVVEMMSTHVGKEDAEMFRPIPDETGRASYDFEVLKKSYTNPGEKFIRESHVEFTDEGVNLGGFWNSYNNYDKVLNLVSRTVKIPSALKAVSKEGAPDEARDVPETRSSPGLE